MSSFQIAAVTTSHWGTMSRKVILKVAVNSDIIDSSGNFDKSDSFLVNLEAKQVV